VPKLIATDFEGMVKEGLELAKIDVNRGENPPFNQGLGF